VLVNNDRCFYFFARRGHHLDIAITANAVLIDRFVCFFGCGYLGWQLKFLLVDILGYFTVCFFGFPLFALFGSLVELFAQFGVFN